MSDLVDFIKRHVPGWILTLVATALGLPLVRFLAGADVTEEAGLLLAYGVLGPIALIVLSFLVFYWLAPARIYADQLIETRSLRGEISRLEECSKTDEDPRMSLTELVDFAEHECGWRIREGEHLEVLDLRDWLSDVAGIGRVQIYGRYNPLNMSNLSNISPVEIPVSHWVEHELYSFDALYYGSNERGMSRNRMDRDRSRAYVDLHVHREQAKKYLRIDGEKWRGRNAKQYEDQKRRSAEFDAMINQKDEDPEHQSPEDIEAETQP